MHHHVAILRWNVLSLGGKTVALSSTQASLRDGVSAIRSHLFLCKGHGVVEVLLVFTGMMGGLMKRLFSWLCLPLSLSLSLFSLFLFSFYCDRWQGVLSAATLRLLLLLVVINSFFIQVCCWMPALFLLFMTDA